MSYRKKTANVFAYIKQVAELCDIRNEESGEKILPNKFKKISYVGKDVALAKYLNPSTINTFNREENYMPIFPFGCNNSQYQAVKKAMENQISVIQGPPGTGKTQTILNIIANIILQEERITRQHQRAQNMAEADYVGKIKKAGSVIYRIIFWTFSIFMLLFALVSFTSSGILSGILFLITAVLVNPLSEDFIRNKLFHLPKWVVIVVLIIGFFAGVLTFSQTNDGMDSTAYYELGEYSM